MKGILYSLCIGTVALALTAQGQQVTGNANVDVRARARTSKAQATTSTKTGATVNTMRSRGTSNMTAATRFHQRSSVTAQTNANAPATTNRNNMRMNRVRTANERNATVNQNASLRSRQRLSQSVAAQNSARIESGRNSRMVSNRESFRSRVSFSQAVTLHRHEFHNRDWWRQHFTIIIINNNAFFFDAGFWFPAWGYFPGAYYPYDGPIYGYNGLAPDQVIVNVQLQLQRDGYYAGPIDGVLGPMTRDALAAFQTDHGLAVTAAIDQETVATLGLT